MSFNIQGLIAGTNITLTSSSTGITIAASGGSGTVTSASVVSANGFAGTVATATTTPAITISTSITGILKGNGTAISAATAGTDYSAGTSALSTGIVKSTTSTGALTIAVAADFPTLNQNTTGTSSNVTGTVAIANGGTGQTTKTLAMDALSPMTTLGDIEYFDGTNVVRLAGNTVNTPYVLTQTGTGSVSAVPAWSVIPTQGQLTYVFANMTSSISGYDQMVSLSSYVAGAAGATSQTVNTGTLLQAFATNVGFPNLTHIPVGNFLCTWTTTKVSNSHTYFSYYSVYKRASGGTETLLGTSANTAGSTLNTAILNTAVPIVISSPVTLLSTDRIVVKIYATDVSGGSTIAVNYDDGTGSQVTFPSAVVDATNFVPYSGATANVNLGTNTITASNLSGTNTGDQTSVSGNSGSTNALISATTTVNVSSATAPTIGQVLTATSSTSATWQTASGSGTVTSFSAGNLSPLFTTSVATSTTTPALSFALSNAGAGTVFGNSTGSSGAPSYTSAPVLGVNATTAGTLGLANGGTSGTTVTLQNLGATSAYNFNLPTTAGATGGIFLSGGGGSTSNTWLPAVAGGSFLVSNGTSTAPTYFNPGNYAIPYNANGSISGSGTYFTYKENGTSPNFNILARGASQTAANFATSQAAQTAPIMTVSNVTGIAYSFDQYARPVTANTTPTIAAGAGAGGSPTISITGTDINGIVTLTTGTLPTLSAVIATISFGHTYTTAPKTVLLTPANAAAAAIAVTSKPYVDTTQITTAHWILESNTSGLVAATQYIWYYNVLG